MNIKTLIWLAVTLASLFAPKLGLREIDDGTKAQLIDGLSLVAATVGAIFTAKSPAITDKPAPASLGEGSAHGA